MFEKFLANSYARGYCPGYGCDSSINENIFSIGLMGLECDAKESVLVFKEI
jgi:hypothetical protein